MPQVFQVLRCYKCFVFQVHQTKKSNKWVCKLCGEKQSLKRHYGLGAGKECRQHVQKLNGLRGEIDELSTSCSISEGEDSDINKEQSKINVIKKESKWSEYTDKTEIEQVPDETEYLNGKEVVLEISEYKSQKRLSKNNFKSQEKTAEQINETVKLFNEPPVKLMFLNNEEIVSKKPKLQTQKYLSNNFERQRRVTKIIAVKTDSCRNVLWNEVPQGNLTETRFTRDNANSECRFATEEYIYPKLKYDECSTTFNSVKMKSDSKWAEYINDSESHNDTEKENKYNEIFSPQQQPTLFNNLFSLCDDEEDLDSILNI